MTVIQIQVDYGSMLPSTEWITLPGFLGEITGVSMNLEPPKVDFDVWLKIKACQSYVQ